MKKLFIVIFLLILLLTACGKNENSILFEKDVDIADKTLVSDTETYEDSEIKNELPEKKSITIYQIDIDVLQTVLCDPEYELKDNSLDKYTYLEGMDKYITLKVTLFEIEQDLIDFLGDYSSVEKYLSENGITTTVKDVIIYESLDVAITALVKTTSGYYFITVCENPMDEHYTYRLYSQDEYVKKYILIHADLSVYGRKLDDDKKSNLYSRYAELPMVAILSELGMKVEWKSDTYAEITHKSKTFVLDIENETLCEKGKSEDDNLFITLPGGFLIVRPAEREVWINDNHLRWILSEMGEEVIVYRDRDKAIVSIEKRQ